MQTDAKNSLNAISNLPCLTTALGSSIIQIDMKITDGSASETNDQNLYFSSSYGPCPHIPNNLTIPQFLLDNNQHPVRPVGRGHEKWLVDDKTGKWYGLKQIRERVFGLANTFKDKWGIGENDVVCIFSPNHIDYPIVIWALHRLGAIATTANPNYSFDELTYQLELTQATHIVCSSSTDSYIKISVSAGQKVGITNDDILLFNNFTNKEIETSYPYSTVEDFVQHGLKMECPFVERRLNDGEGQTKIALLCFSSGTTGRPKAVEIPHYAVIANVIQMTSFYRVNDDAYWNEEIKSGRAKAKRMQPGDISIAVLPFYHIYGLVVNIHMVLFVGMSLIVIPKFDFVENLKSIVKYKITHLFIVPPQAVLFCKHPAVKQFDLSGVRFVMSGAAPMSKEITEQLVKVLPNASIGQGYGMTESSTTLTWFPLSQHIGTPGSAGQLLPGVIARVVKDDGSLGCVGEIGELQVRAPNLTCGYLKNEVATKETFVNGWLRTGDQVIFDESGDVFVVDRLKEIFKVRGFQVAPAELEGHLLNHPDVNDCCVVGVPDDYSGEIPLAFVVLRDGAISTEGKEREEAAENIKRDIFEHVKKSKVHFKWLTGGVEFVDAIPKNPSGKLLRRVLRERAKELKEQREVKKELAKSKL